MRCNPNECELEKLTAENERLRAGITEIGKHAKMAAGEPDNHANAQHMRGGLLGVVEKARATLSDGSDN